MARLKFCSQSLALFSFRNSQLGLLVAGAEVAQPSSKLNEIQEKHHIQGRKK